MASVFVAVLVLAVSLGSSLQAWAQSEVSGSQPTMSAPASTSLSMLAPPSGAGPVIVRARFDLYDLNEINDGAETFEFTGVMSLTWRDPRQAFNPATEGVDEKVFQGEYQFNELAPGWYPQVVLVNEAGSYQKSGVVLRIRPDGTSILVETLNAVAEADVSMKLFPFDSHRLDAVFEVLGFDHNEVVLEVDQSAPGAPTQEVRVPQWSITGIGLSVRDRHAAYAGPIGISSAFTVSIDVRRAPFYAVRLVVIPLAIIVLLSFSVFWMDRSSLGDRISVSFIGILTGVAYQIVMSDNLPRISYVTLMHGFLSMSFLTMCATVVINLVVGSMDAQGRKDDGDRLDRRCRWLFPLIYFGLITVVAFIVFQLL